MGFKMSKAFVLLLIILTFGQDARGASENLFLYSGLNPNVNKQVGGYFNYKFINPKYFSVVHAQTDDERIYGGQYAREGQFPFVAAVHKLLGGGAFAQCGGTIISSRWVLTAGHCIAKQPKVFRVIFGIVNKAGYNYNSRRGISMLTRRYILHPQYSVTTNDIGLLYMPRDIPFSRYIQPIRLPSENYASETFAGRTAIVTGWGKDRDMSTGTLEMKYAILPIISNYECRKHWAVTDKNICTAAEIGQDACQGDSGGPLIVFEYGRPLQVGIVSYGDDDCPSSKSGVFTRVTSYVDWIRAVTQASILLA